MSEEREPTVTDLHESLFHYTTADGLKGILEDQCLWATDHRFLNDEHEMRPDKNPILQEIIDDTTKHLREEPDHLALIKEAKKIFFKELEEQTLLNGYHILSFCSHNQNEYALENGLLSQWRGYGKDGGYAIEFDARKIHENSRSLGFLFVLAKVYYKDNCADFNPAYNNGFIELKSFLKEICDQLKKRNYGQEKIFFPIANQTVLATYIEALCRVKNVGFQEENEIRIVYLEPVMTDIREALPVSYRNDKGTLVPYVKLFKAPDPILSHAIKRIIVGPHKDKELRAQTLREMLRSKQTWKHIADKIDVSDIPYI